MAKDNKKQNEEVEEITTKETAKEITFESSYKNLIIAGTSIQFKDGVYSTSNENEIEILRNNNLVTEAGE
jgi:F0F1-type ATP synthase delta subunit